MLYIAIKNTYKRQKRDFSSDAKKLQEVLKLQANYTPKLIFSGAVVTLIEFV